jgi:hypothetical protein
MLCAGCCYNLEDHPMGDRAEKRVTEAATKLYGQEDFLENFRWCSQPQRLWEPSEEGKRVAPELPKFVRFHAAFGDEDGSVEFRPPPDKYWYTVLGMKSRRGDFEGCGHRWPVYDCGQVV